MDRVYMCVVESILLREFGLKQPVGARMLPSTLVATPCFTIGLHYIEDTD